MEGPAPNVAGILAAKPCQNCSGNSGVKPSPLGSGLAATMSAPAESHGVQGSSLCDGGGCGFDDPMFTGAPVPLSCPVCAGPPARC